MLDSSASATDSDSLDSLVIPPDDALTLPDPEASPSRPAPRGERNVKIIVLTHNAHLARVQGDSRCLEHVVTDQLRDFTPGAPLRWQDDRCIFAGGRLVAAIRRAKDGSAIVTRFAP
jgi:hypothetical protein